MNRLLSNMKCMQLRVKIKSEKLLGIFPNMCRSKSISSLNMVEEWKLQNGGKRRYSKFLQQEG